MQTTLTDTQKAVIRNHSKEYSAPQLAKLLNVTIWTVKQFQAKEKLTEKKEVRSLKESEKDFIRLHKDEFPAKYFIELFGVSKNSVYNVLNEKRKHPPKPKIEISDVLARYKPAPEPVYFNNKYYDI